MTEEPRPASASADAQMSTEEEESMKYVRITNHGKMKAWVTHSLEFLSESSGQGKERTVVFHTFPLSVDPKSGSDDTVLQPVIVGEQSAANSTLTISRLISVVEIIKREYCKLLEERKSTRVDGLYQYNELGTLEQLGVTVSSGDGKEVAGEAEEAAARSARIIEAMGGINHPRQTQSPYMRITLSTVERPELITPGTTFQPPTRRKITKSAKARLKKRGLKSKEVAST